MENNISVCDTLCAGHQDLQKRLIQVGGKTSRNHSPAKTLPQVSDGFTAAELTACN